MLHSFPFLFSLPLWSLSSLAVPFLTLVFCCFCSIQFFWQKHHWIQEEIEKSLQRWFPLIFEASISFTCFQRVFCEHVRAVLSCYKSLLSLKCNHLTFQSDKLCSVITKICFLQLLQIFFETFNVPALFISMQAVLSLWVQLRLDCSGQLAENTHKATASMD